MGNGLNASHRQVQVTDKCKSQTLQQIKKLVINTTRRSIQQVQVQ